MTVKPSQPSKPGDMYSSFMKRKKKVLKKKNDHDADDTKSKKMCKKHKKVHCKVC